MQLSKVQARFKDVMLDHPDVVANPPADLDSVFETGDIALSERLKVYRNNIVGSLTDVMVASFPVIDKLVSTPFLEQMARSFILKNPPTHGCLNFYGGGFAEFIEGFEPTKSLPYLPDIARLEIAMNDSYYARDDEALDAEALASIPPEELGDLCLTPRHNVRLLHSLFPLCDIRDFALSDGEGDAPDMNKGEVFLMIHRPALDTQIVVLDEAEFSFLQKLQGGAALGPAVEGVLNDFQGFDFQGFLQKHIAFETFMALEANTSP